MFFKMYPNWSFPLSFSLWRQVMLMRQRDMLMRQREMLMCRERGGTQIETQLPRPFLFSLQSTMRLPLHFTVVVVVVVWPLGWWTCAAVFRLTVVLDRRVRIAGTRCCVLGRGRECGNCRRLGVDECRLERRGEGPCCEGIRARSPPLLCTRVNVPLSVAAPPCLVKAECYWYSGHHSCPV